MPANKLERQFRGKRILVTGGTGSIGSEIVRQLLRYKPRQVRIYSRDEGRQHELAMELGGHPNLSFLIGDVRDKERLFMAMENVDIVFHAAAMKHVNACEINPFEAVKTNVGGTQNIIDCAFAQKVDKVISISTDKAADPISVMGSTKLLAERLMLSTYFYKGNKKTKFSCVRFGNVLGSRGSVAPIFVSQMRAKAPLTVTDPTMTRFFMLIREAVSLVFNASLLMKDREIFVPKVATSVTMGDFTRAMIELGKEKGVVQGARAVAIKNIGRKSGEKMHEILLTHDESMQALETDELYIILPNVKLGSPTAKIPHYPNARKAKVGEYSSGTHKKLTITQLISLLKEVTELLW